jgi:hypothetical protein
MSQLAASDGQPGNWEEPGSFCVGFRPQGLKSKAGRSRVNREVHVRLCVQLRLVCSAGVSPARVTVRSPVAWMAGMSETDYLKPIDKAILRGCERVTGP